MYNLEMKTYEQQGDYVIQSLEHFFSLNGRTMGSSPDLSMVALSLPQPSRNPLALHLTTSLPHDRNPGWGELA